MEIFKTRYFLYQTLGKAHSNLIGISNEGEEYVHPKYAFKELVKRHFDKKNTDKLTELYVGNECGFNYGYCSYKNGGFRNLTADKQEITEALKEKDAEAQQTNST